MIVRPRREGAMYCRPKVITEHKREEEELLSEAGH